MIGIMIDKDATVEWLKGWGENTPHMDSARIIEAQDIKIAALEAENAALRQRLVVDDAMVAGALSEYVGNDRYARAYEYCDAQFGPKMRAALEAALGKDKR